MQWHADRHWGGEEDHGTGAHADMLLISIIKEVAKHGEGWVCSRRPQYSNIRLRSLRVGGERKQRGAAHLFLSPWFSDPLLDELYNSKPAPQSFQTTKPKGFQGMEGQEEEWH